MANVVAYGKLFAPNEINDAANETIFTAVTSSTAGVVKNISAVVCNTTGTGATLEIWIVPSAGSADDTNKLINGETVPANGRLSFTVPDMSSGDTLVARAGTATALTIHAASGVVFN